MHLESFVERLVRSKAVPPPALIVGETGVGKTAIIREVCSRLEVPFFEPPALSTLAPEDIIGIPVPCDEKGRPLNGTSEAPESLITRWAAPEFWQKVAEAGKDGKRVVLFLDELNRASIPTQNAVFPVLFGRPRMAGSVRLPDNIVILAAANPPSYQVNPVCQALLARFIVFHWNPTPDQWSEWAIGAGLHPDVIGFLSQNPGLLSTSGDSDLAADATQNLNPVPRPRAWEFASNRLAEEGDQAAFEAVNLAIACAVGQEAATAFLAWREGLKDLPSADDVLDGIAAMPYHPAKAIVTAARVVDRAASLAVERNDVQHLIRLFRCAVEWPSELVYGVLDRRLRAVKLPGGPRWILEVLQAVPDIATRHRDVFAILRGGHNGR